MVRQQRYSFCGQRAFVRQCDHCPYVQEAPKNVQELWERLRTIAVAARQYVT